MIENDLATRATDLTLYVRFLAVAIIALGVINVVQAFRDAQYLKLLLAGAVTIFGVYAVTDPEMVIDWLRDLR